MGLAPGIPTGNPRYSLDSGDKHTEKRATFFKYIFAIVAIGKQKEEEANSGTNVTKRIAHSEACKR